MGLTFVPSMSMVLMCNFDTGFRPPEMVKVRPVVVMSPQRHNGRTCVIVPISTTAPNLIGPMHHELDLLSLPPRLRKVGAHWAKCDMVTTVGLERLDRVKNGRDANGKRLFATHSITRDDLTAIRAGVLVALGLGMLSPHLTPPGTAP